MNSNINCIHKPKWRWWNLFYPVIFNYEEESFVCKKCGARIQRKFPLTHYERILHSGGVFFLALIASILINLPFMPTPISSQKNCIIILVETLLIAQPLIRAFVRLFQYRFVKYTVVEGYSKSKCICEIMGRKKKHIPKISIKDFFLISFRLKQNNCFVCKNCNKIITLKHISVDEYCRRTSVFGLHFAIFYLIISQAILSNIVSISVFIIILNVAIFILSQIILVYLYESRRFEFVEINE